MKFSDLRAKDINNMTDEQIYDLMMSGIQDLASSSHIKDDKLADFIIVLGASPIALKARIIKALELYQEKQGKNILFSGGNGWHRLYTFDNKKTYISLSEQWKTYSEKRMKYNGYKRALGKMIPAFIRPKATRKLGPKASYRYMGRKLKQAMKSTESELSSKIVEACKGLVVIDDSCLFFENSSTNTKENAVNSLKLIEKLIESGQIESLKRIIIISSCYHCKRSELTFKKFFEKYPNVEILVCPSTLDLKDEELSLSKESIIKSTKMMKRYRNELNAIIKYLNFGDLADATIDDIIAEKIISCRDDNPNTTAKNSDASHSKNTINPNR